MFSTLTPVIFAENTIAMMTPGEKARKGINNRRSSDLVDAKRTIDGDNFTKDDPRRMDRIIELVPDVGNVQDKLTKSSFSFEFAVHAHHLLGWKHR